MEAVLEKNRVCYELTVHLVSGRCGHVAHVIKAEMKEDVDRYSSEQRDKIAGRVHNLEARCECKSNHCVLCYNCCCCCCCFCRWLFVVVVALLSSLPSALVMFRDTVSKARDKFNEIHSETECHRALQDATEKVMITPQETSLLSCTARHKHPPLTPPIPSVMRSASPVSLISR